LIDPYGRGNVGATKPAGRGWFLRFGWRGTDLVATVLSMPVPARAEAPEPAPTSRERQALRDAIRMLAAAVAAAEEARQPIGRLEAAIAAAAGAEQELDQLHREDQQRIASWLTSGAEIARPQPAPELLAAERRLAIVMRDAAGAKQAMPPLVDSLNAAYSTVRTAQRRRDDAVFLAAGAIAQARLAKLTERIAAVLAIEAELDSVVTELQRLGHRSEADHVALGVAAQIREMAIAAKRSAAIAPDPRIGVALLQRLMVDPAADFTQENHDGDKPTAA
jgi:hypothetical protein